MIDIFIAIFEKLEKASTWRSSQQNHNIDKAVLRTGKLLLFLNYSIQLCNIPYDAVTETCIISTVTMIMAVSMFIDQ